MRILTRNVIVHTDAGSESVGPGPCPDRLARLITMPGVWVDDNDVVADDTETDDAEHELVEVSDGGVVERPPESGKGSGVNAWRAYAEALDLDIDEGMTKADIVAVVAAAEASEG